MRTIKEIETEILCTLKKLESLSSTHNNEVFTKTYEELNRLKKEREVVSIPIAVSNDEFDLRVEQKTDVNYIYHIFLKDTIKKLGYIRVTYSEKETIYGNIGYEIFKPYRGKSIALKTLEMLEDTMIEKGLTKPIITVMPDNESSIKVIEKFGGKFVEDKKAGVTYKKYEVDLLEKRNIYKKK